jgi:hypothetical protein
METEHCEALHLRLSFETVRDLLDLLCQSDAGDWSNEIADLHGTLVKALSDYDGSGIDAKELSYAE